MNTVMSERRTALKTSAFLFISALLAMGALSCSRDISSPLVPGVSTRADVLQAMGQPLNVYSFDPNSDTQILEYARNETFQIEGEKVVAHWRTPYSQERTLQYWLHRWKGLKKRQEKVKGAPDSDGIKYFQLIVPSLQMAVIYDAFNGRVSKVVTYANK